MGWLKEGAQALKKQGAIVNAMEASSLNIIGRFLGAEDIALDVEVSGKAELLDLIGRQMELQHDLPHESVAPGLSRREQLGSTALGQGVAIPHCRVKNLDRILPAYLRLRQPIPFDAPDGKPVFDVLVLLVPKQATEEHLQILADATQLFSDRQFRARLQQCVNPSEVEGLFRVWPRLPQPAF